MDILRHFILFFVIYSNSFAEKVSVSQLPNNMCMASNLKVRSSRFNYFLFGNLENSIVHMISYDQKSSNHHEIIKKIKEIETENKTFNLYYRSSSLYGNCDYIENFQDITGVEVIENFSYENYKCIKLSDSKLFLSVVDFQDFNKVLQALNATPVDPDKMAYIQKNLTMIIHNSLKEDAGFAPTIFFYSYFLELLYEQGVREISQEQFFQMLHNMNLDLPPSFYEKISQIFSKLKSIKMEKHNNTLSLNFNMREDQMIPAHYFFDKSDKDNIPESSYFEGINISKSAKIKIKDSDLSVEGQYKSTIEIEGISGVLDFPVYGNLHVTAKKVVLYSDSDKSNIDLKAGRYISLSKNLPLSMNFEF